MTKPDRSESCKNCGTSLDFRFCPACGQDGREPPVSLRSLLGLFVKNMTGVEGLTVKTLRDLLFRPGRLTRAYTRGQRARYLSPVQLYLWCTAGFFLLHAYSPLVQLHPETGEVQSSLSALSLGTKLSPGTLSRLAEKGESLASFAPRFDAAVTAYLPILLLGLVAATSLLMATLFWQELTIKHTVFTLHWSAFYFVLETARRSLLNLGQWGAVASGLGSLVALIYLTVAMRTVYRRSWFGSALRALLSLVVFAALLGGWLWSTTKVAAVLASWKPL